MDKTKQNETAGTTKLPKPDSCMRSMMGRSRPSYILHRASIGLFGLPYLD